MEHSPSSRFKEELYARAVAYSANAARAQGNLRRAAEIFGHARYLLKAQGATDRRTRAELDHIEGALCRDQRRLHEAQRLLERAALGYRRERDAAGEARVLMTLSMVHREMGDVASAVEATRRSLELIDPEDEPRLKLYAGHNLANRLCDIGEHPEAHETLNRIRHLYRPYQDAWTQLRLAWLEARISRGLGETGAAEEGFRSVRDGFLQEGNAYDAALVSLELATMYLEQGRTGEVKALAEETVPAFEAQEVHRETLAALILFRDAAQAEGVTLAFLRELATYLERARLDPALPFQSE